MSTDFISIVPSLLANILFEPIRNWFQNDVLLTNRHGMTEMKDASYAGAGKFVVSLIIPRYQTLVRKITAMYT